MAPINKRIQIKSIAPTLIPKNKSFFSTICGI